MMRFLLSLLALIGFVVTLVNAGGGLVEGMNQVVPAHCQPQRWWINSAFPMW